MGVLNGPIKPKRSTVTGEVPSGSDLENGELAANTADGKLFVKHTDGTVKEISGGGGGGGGATSIDDLTDVDTSTAAPTDGQALVWNNTASEWRPGTVSGGGGGGATSINDLTDVDTATAAPTDGQALVWSSANNEWEPGTVSSGASSLDDLSDVSFSSGDLSITGLDKVAFPNNADVTVDTQLEVITTSGGNKATRFDLDGVTSHGNIVAGSYLQYTRNSGANYVRLDAPEVTSDLILTLPAADGSSGDILATDGAGNLSFAPPAASISWQLTANGSTDYIFTGPGLDGVNDPTVYLMRGQTYKFVNEMNAHPFRIQQVGGAAYSDGITNNDVSNGTLIFEVPMNAPATLEYVCTSHPAMTGTIYILDESVPVSSVNGEIGVVSLGIQDMDDYAAQPDASGTAFHDAKQTDGNWSGSSTTQGGFAFNGNAKIYINRSNPTSGTDLVTQGFVAATTLDLWVSADGLTYTQHTATNSYNQANNALFTNLSPDLSAYASDTALYFRITAPGGSAPLVDGDVVQWNSTASAFQPTQLDVISLTTLKAEVAASADFGDFQSRIAAL